MDVCMQIDQGVAVQISVKTSATIRNGDYFM